MDQDFALGDASIRHCRLLNLRWGEAVPYAELARGFPYRDAWIKLVGPQGVFKPKEMTDGPLTLLSTLASSYKDRHLEGDVMHVRLRSAQPRARERRAKADRRHARRRRPITGERPWCLGMADKVRQVRGAA